MCSFLARVENYRFLKHPVHNSVNFGTWISPFSPHKSHKQHKSCSFDTFYAKTNLSRRRYSYIHVLCLFPVEINGFSRVQLLITLFLGLEFPLFPHKSHKLHKSCSFDIFYANTNLSRHQCSYSMFYGCSWSKLTVFEGFSS